MKKLDLINKKYGLLTILEEYGKTKGGHIKFKCLCDCGNTIIRTGTSIRRSKNSSCGCFSLFGSNNPLWKGVGEISANWFDSKVRRSADGSKGNRKIKELNIDIQYLWDLFLEQDRKCVYTGLVLTFPKLNTNKEFTKSTASVDRIDSNKGYIKGNVQFVHKDINIMKNTFNQEYFINMCKLVAGGNCEIK